ncbi:hypothetical protein Tco_0801033 [Tanacetum coccineum]|uniref:Transposase n=1 Tax=Tanacetum coccineum TaxID=301880 RepID=A0ABQ4ZUV8_9ASTR
MKRAIFASPTKDGQDKEEDEVKIALMHVQRGRVQTPKTKAVKVAVAMEEFTRKSDAVRAKGCVGQHWVFRIDAKQNKKKTLIHGMPLGEYGAVFGIQWLGANHMRIFQPYCSEEILKFTE